MADKETERLFDKALRSSRSTTGPTPTQIHRLEKDWSEIADETITVEFIKGAAYGYGTELGCLRIFKKYIQSGSTWKQIKTGYSKNLRRWYIVLEPRY